METDVPCDHNVSSVEVLKPGLARSWTVKEEVLDLLSVEVAVLVKCHEDGDIASG